MPLQEVEMEQDIPVIVLKPGKEKQPKNHHPWIFSGAVGHPRKNDIPTEPHVVKVVDSANTFVAYGWCDTPSHIMIRLLSWDPGDMIDEHWVVSRVRESIQRRMNLIVGSKGHTNAFRLIHGEADFLPGVAVDMFSSSIVILLSSSFALMWKQVLVTTLQSLINPAKIFVQVDESFVAEDSKSVSGLYVGGKKVESVSERELFAACRENDIHYLVPVNGQKTGFYCDQRENRRITATYTEGKDVLDLFSYTGGFTLNALKSGARSVCAVDSSQKALALLNQHIRLNEEKGVIRAGSSAAVTTCKDNVFEYLRKIDPGKYDVIIVDPPKLASVKSQVPQALKAYKDLNRLAFEKVRKGGLVATFSCSAGVGIDDLKMAVAWAAKDAHKEIHILSFFHQSSDHPVRISFPESNYLKGFLLEII